MQTEFKFNNRIYLFRGRRRRGLRMAKCSVHSLMGEIGQKICLKGRTVVQRRDCFAAVKHHSAQETEICGRKWSAVNRYDWLTVDGVARYCATIGIVRRSNRVLRV